MLLSVGGTGAPSGVRLHLESRMMIAPRTSSLSQQLCIQRPSAGCTQWHVPVKALCRRRPVASSHSKGLQSSASRCSRKYENVESFRKDAFVAILIGAFQLGSPALAADQILSQNSTAGTAAPAESPVPPAQPDSERAVPRGVRPGRPFLAQPVDAPAPAGGSSGPSTASVTEAPDKRQAADRKAELQPDPSATSAAAGPQQKPSADAVKPSKPAADAAKPSKAGAAEDGDKEAKRLLDEEEERRKQRRRKKGRIRELEEIRAELAEKELVLLSKEQELLERDQTVNVLREELELEKKLRTLLTKEKEKAEEQSALALGLCTGGSIF